MSKVETTVQTHYGGRDVLARILSALRGAGIDTEDISHEDLFRFDQLHGRGVAATRDHAGRAGLHPGMHVLDLGCGVGGASRYLAAVCSCRVTGVDLTRAFVDVATELTARCGLGDRIAFQQANALDLPFEDGTFDHVWSHNVTMNIADKEGFATEVARVLRPGSQFSCVEFAEGAAGEPHYPLPWATDASSSFLVTPEDMRAALEGAGLRVVEQTDLTGIQGAWDREQREKAARGEAAVDMPPVIATVVMGDEQAARVQNSRRSAAEGRVVEQFILAAKG